MNFSEALNAIKNGELVAREGWNSKDMFIFLVDGSTFNVNRKPLLGIFKEGTLINYQPHIDMKTADGTIVPWLASQSDVLADDWDIVGEDVIYSGVLELNDQNLTYLTESDFQDLLDTFEEISSVDYGYDINEGCKVLIFGSHVDFVEDADKHILFANSIIPFFGS